MTLGSGFQFTCAQRASSVSAVTCVENAGMDAAGIDISVLSILLCTIPVFAVVFAYAILREPMTVQLERHSFMRPGADRCAVLLQQGQAGPIVGAALLRQC